jgi:hypothetical protein
VIALDDAGPDGLEGPNNEKCKPDRRGDTQMTMQRAGEFRGQAVSYRNKGRFMRLSNKNFPVWADRFL